MTDTAKILPKLRFPEFENDGGWKVVRLGEFITVNSGKDYKHLNFGSIPVYGTGGYMLSVDEELSNIDAVGIGRKGTIDKPQFLKAPFWTVDTLFFLTPQNGFDVKFIYYLSQTIQWKKYAEQTGVPSLSKVSIEHIETIIPPSLPEQQKIATFLTSLDEQISAHTKKLEALKTHKKGLMQQLFPANGEKTPKLRFPEFKNDGEWNFANGDKLFKPIVNKQHSSDLPVLAITQEQGAVPREMIDYNVIVSDKSIENYKIVEIGDFIISLRSFQGGIEYSHYKGLCSPAYIVLRKTNDNVCDEYYRHYFKSHQYIQDLNRNLEGIRDGKMVSYKQFSEIKIPHPSYIEQQKIASFLTSIDEMIQVQDDKIRKLKTYKNGLMQQMFPSVETPYYDVSTDGDKLTETPCYDVHTDGDKLTETPCYDVHTGNN